MKSSGGAWFVTTASPIHSLYNYFRDAADDFFETEVLPNVKSYDTVLLMMA